ncbi:hypothetical protein AXF42_Ash013730 [Apostasia shenzhenica]|uniref:Uncharacterized protein n=1 Tax=Apostasia shenzhenica TaxID=1088818 RepID=A0A2I0A4P3_9ASPA|nr:hypothetical protein AXF42_Ash013730 [Apostasia shenzhenica]
MAAASEQHKKPTAPASPAIPTNLGDRAFKGLGDLIRLLPSGTVFLFQFLSPLLTNSGHCAAVNRYLSAALLAACGLSCCFSSFTDSYVAGEGRIYYGVATVNGLWAFSDPEASNKDLSRYRLRPGDFVHAFLSLVVFVAIALLDSNTVSCFYPLMAVAEGTMIMVLPTVVGGMASTAFILFPNDRHGIGYPPALAVDFEPE